jgi:hypothetical protein
MDQELRESLRRRAHGRCEYCRLPEKFSLLRFQADHITARKHGGGDAPANLAWACADCNAYKGTDLTGIDAVTGRTERLFNPRLEEWQEHFRMEGARIVGKTTIGRVTVELLQMNREERLALRAELLSGGFV